MCLTACTTRGWVLSLTDGDASSKETTHDGRPAEAGMSRGEGRAPPASETEAGAHDSGAHDSGVPVPVPNDFATVCSPAITFRNTDATVSGKLFDQAIPDPSATLVGVSRRVCALLFRHPQDVPVVSRIALIVESFDGVADSNNDTLRVSSRYVQTIADQNGDIRGEIEGIFYFIVASVYQFSDENNAAPSWVVTGVGDCIRYQAGFTPLSRRQRGGNFTDGFRTTGFFLAWVSERYPGFLPDLNRSLSPTDGVVWSSRAFETLTGQGVDALWSAYQKTL
jgi:hypothetical protein